MYRGFEAINIKKLLKTGRDSYYKDEEFDDGDFIFCSTESEILSLCDEDAFKYARLCDNPAIAVFDGDYFDNVMPYTYRYKECDDRAKALVAVYKLKYPYD